MYCAKIIKKRGIKKYSTLKKLKLIYFFYFIVKNAINNQIITTIAIHIIQTSMPNKMILPYEMLVIPMCFNAISTPTTTDGMLMLTLTFFL